jgi:hypothetical protein
MTGAGTVAADTALNGGWRKIRLKRVATNEAKGSSMTIFRTIDEYRA